jgi:uncharacterized tellurite resistance protein B-like protein
MFDSIKSFFEMNLAIASNKDDAALLSKLDLASAALLVEVMRSDHHMDTRETEEILDVLRSCLDVSEQDLTDILTLAQAEARQATSLYEFTRLINDGYDYEQKLILVRNLWRVAYADKALDKYEDHLIRKIADLIYISHSDFIRMKLEVRDACGAS